MSSSKTKVVHSYCLSNTEHWALFLVNQKAQAGDIFRITRENLTDCFQLDEDDNSPEIPEVDEDTKRVGLTFSNIFSISDNPEDDFLVFVFDEDADEKDSFILKPSVLTNVRNQESENKATNNQ